MALSLLVAAHETTALARPGGACRVPNALRKAGEKEAARELYVAIVKRNPGKSCAITGLESLNKPEKERDPPSCVAGDDAFAAGDLSAARSEYEEVGSANDCASAGLAEVRAVQQLCRQGNALVDLDLEDEARKAYEAALERNPHYRCAVTGLRSLASGLIERMTLELPNVLQATGLFLVGLFLFLLLGWVPPFNRALPRLPLVGRVLSPRLMIKPLDDDALGAKVGAAMASRISERLHRYREEAVKFTAESDDDSGFDLDLGRGEEEFASLVSGDSALEGALEKASGLSEHTKLVGALLTILYTLLPIRKLTVAGVIDPPAASGATATFTLENRSRLASATALAGPALSAVPTAPDYLRLADPAAVWVQYSVARVLTDADLDRDDAESYALLRQGITSQIEGNLGQARAAYEAAVELNPRNWPARVNLAMTEARLAKNFRVAIYILREALSDMRDS